MLQEFKKFALRGNVVDLAIGVMESFGNIGSAGAVHVLYGDDPVLSAAGNQFWHQNVAGIALREEGVIAARVSPVEFPARCFHLGQTDEHRLLVRLESPHVLDDDALHHQRAKSQRHEWTTHAGAACQRDARNLKVVRADRRAERFKMMPNRNDGQWPSMMFSATVMPGTR